MVPRCGAWGHREPLTRKVYPIRRSVARRGEGKSGKGWIRLSIGLRFDLPKLRAARCRGRRLRQRFLNPPQLLTDLGQLRVDLPQGRPA